ncbi:hypothetical protein NKH18_01955 [Streptomyces sp. M10(2022)]
MWPAGRTRVCPACGPHAGPGATFEERADTEVSVHLLRDEISRLHRHVERLSREQQELVGRIDRLTSHRASGQ